MRDAAPAVQMLRYPTEQLRREEFARSGIPVVLLLDGVQAPAVLHPLEACVSRQVEPIELRTVMRNLERRARTVHGGTVTIDEDAVLRHDGRWVALPPGEVDLAALLIAHFGDVVPSADLERATGREIPPNSSYLRVRMRRLRAHLGSVGLDLRSVPNRGYALMALARPTGASLPFGG